MSPVLICAEYPKESYTVGEKISLQLFVINDLLREIGQVDWEWELLVGGSSVASGEGETSIPKDCVVGIGEAVATPPAPGPAILKLRLFGDEPLSNEYRFSVSASANKKLTS